jgi:thiol-disulfide isomerase/thioredoxin
LGFIYKNNSTDNENRLNNSNFPTNIDGMKRLLFFILFTTISQCCFCQVDSTPIYLRYPTIPEFTISRAQDSSAFNREDLKRKKETIFIVFSPDCEFCQRETKVLIENIDKFNKVQIVMTTVLPFDQMVEYYNDFKLANHPIITMGRDGQYFFHTFFNVKYLPAIFIYDKKGRFKKGFEGSVKIEKILEEL